MRVRRFPDAPNRNMERVVVEVPINNGEIHYHLHVTRLSTTYINISWKAFGASLDSCANAPPPLTRGSAMNVLQPQCVGLSVLYRLFVSFLCIAAGYRLLALVHSGAQQWQSSCHLSDSSSATDKMLPSLTQALFIPHHCIYYIRLNFIVIAQSASTDTTPYTHTLAC